MFRKALLEWLYHWLMGVGCSLVAVAAVGVITDGSPTLISFSAVVGVTFQLLSLVIELTKAIPPTAEYGEK